jgi:hypothetical protein
MKKLIILASFALIFSALPFQANAGFKLEQLVDPACLFLCENEPDVVNYTNSNNVNSNVNSPDSVVNTPGTPVYYQTPTYVYDNNYSVSPLTVSCYSSYMTTNVGNTIVWHASMSGGNGNYYATWSGSEGLSGNGSSVSIRYDRSGTKTASVSVTSGGQTVSRNCNSVVVYGYSDNNNYNSYNYNNYYNGDDYDYNRNRNNRRYDDRILTVSCSASTNSSTIGNTVRWTSYVSGGSGNYTYNWTGTDSIYGSDRDVEVIYNAGGLKSAAVTVRSGGQTVTQNCSNTITIAGPVVNYTNTGGTNTVVKYVEVPAKKPVVEDKVKATDSDNGTLSSIFSLLNVPWGLVSILVILVLLFIIFYLMFNS